MKIVCQYNESLSQTLAERIGEFFYLFIYNVQYFTIFGWQKFRERVGPSNWATDIFERLSIFQKVSTYDVRS